MQKFGTLRQSLLGELAMSQKKERKSKNTIKNRHYVLPKGSARTSLGPKFEMNELSQAKCNMKVCVIHAENICDASLNHPQNINEATLQHF